MKFLSSNFFHTFFTLTNLMTVVNKFVEDQEYFVVKKRTKNNKKDVFRKVVFRCDCDKLIVEKRVPAVILELGRIE
jgi:hypothetical protein